MLTSIKEAHRQFNILDTNMSDENGWSEAFIALFKPILADLKVIVTTSVQYFSESDRLTFPEVKRRHLSNCSTSSVILICARSSPTSLWESRESRSGSRTARRLKLSRM